MHDTTTGKGGAASSDGSRNLDRVLEFHCIGHFARQSSGSAIMAIRTIARVQQRILPQQRV
jgi:hypothetical protein